MVPEGGPEDEKNARDQVTGCPGRLRTRPFGKLFARCRDPQARASACAVCPLAVSATNARLVAHSQSPSAIAGRQGIRENSATRVAGPGRICFLRQESVVRSQWSLCGGGFFIR